MEYSTEITGKDIFDIFRNLISERRLIRIRLKGMDYEQLSMVLDIQTRGINSPFFRIDPPKEFDAWAENINNGLQFEFEFTDSEGIKYQFSTSEVMLSGEEIWFGFPEFIGRFQRRKDFRVEFPKGTFIRFRTGIRDFKLDVIDISLGGLAAKFLVHQSVVADNPLLSEGRILEDIEIICPSENTTVRINKALILRLNKENIKNRLSLAMQFLKIDKNDLDTLKDLIYGVQRSYLKNRFKAQS